MSTLSKLGAVYLTLIGLATGPCAGQEANPFEAQKTEAYRLFQHGKIKDAASKLREAANLAPTVLGKLQLQRDILEVCTTAYDVRCVSETIQEMLPLIRADSNLTNNFPELMLYELKANVWMRSDEYVEQILIEEAPVGSHIF